MNSAESPFTPMSASGRGLVDQLRRFLHDPKTLETSKQVARETKDPAQRKRMLRLIERHENYLREHAE